MDAAKSLFGRLIDSGVILSITANGRLSIDAPRGFLTEGVVSEMGANREDLLALVEQWGERAAIMEYDGGLARVDAERLALVDVLGAPPSPEYLPEEPGWLCPWCRRGDRLADDPGGLRCDRCNRLAWRWIGRSFVRADFISSEL